MTPYFKEQLGCEGSMSQHDALTLEPCPHCGKYHTPKIVLASEHWADEYDGDYPHSERYAVMCDASSPNGPGGCGASGGFHATEDEAVASWNRRAALSATQPAQAAQSEPLPEHADHMPEIAARLRLVARLAGCADAVPEDDRTAVGCIFSVLGNMRRALELKQAAQGEPDGMVPAPHYRGYAVLGIGEYLINHTPAGDPAELVISIASDADKDGRVVGDERDNLPGAMIQPEQMAVRVRFENVAGLDALEGQLRYVRGVHFPGSIKHPAVAQGAGEVVGVYGGTSNYGDIIVLYEDLKVGTKLYTQPAAGADVLDAHIDAAIAASGRKS